MTLSAMMLSIVREVPEVKMSGAIANMMARRIQGRSDRTALMMSTPLKFSGPFSSKIGVFWTASS